MLFTIYCMPWKLLNPTDILRIFKKELLETAQNQLSIAIFSAVALLEACVKNDVFVKISKHNIINLN